MRRYISLASWPAASFAAMSAYSQVKRQKVREVRPGENVDYFQGIDKVEYNNMAPPTDVSGYRYYSGTERVHSRAMDDWLKYSVCLTDFRSNGSDSHYRSPHRPWDDGSNTLDNHKRCIKALFDFCTKLGVKYWTAFDSDLVPGADAWDEAKQHWDDVVEYVQELMQRTHLKLLWLAPDLHSHPRYASGAFTSSDASTFAQAAAQVKRCVDASQRLGAEAVLLWPREGYHSGVHTDVARELKLFAKLLKITADYKDRLNYRCQLLLMPYHTEQGWSGRAASWPNKAEHSYMWDVTSCLYLLKSYSLERHYKVCTPPGHHMFMANVYNMLGGVVITNDVDPCDNKKLTLMMKCIIDQGIPLVGGVNLKLVPRRDSDPRSQLTQFVRYADAVAKGLRLAAALLAEQAFSKQLQQRYGSYYSGFGSRLASADVTMEECEDYYKKNQTPHNEAPSASTRLENMDLMLQRFLDSSDHI